MTNKEYNGWFNYETWLAKLWMDNDEGDSSYWNEQAEECYKQAKGDASDDDPQEEIEAEAAQSLARQLEDQFGGRQQELAGVTGFWSDMLGAAMSEVNWQEIAEHLIENVDKEQFANT
jgi:hypothetical protein